MEEQIMKKRVALFGMIPVMLFGATVEAGYAQGKADNTMPAYYSYSYNTPVAIDVMKKVEHWMLVDFSIKDYDHSGFMLEQWMLGNDVSKQNKKLENWMLNIAPDVDTAEIELLDWMLNAELDTLQPELNAINESFDELEDWMLKAEQEAEPGLIDAVLKVMNWMFNGSFSENEEVNDVESWMVDGF
jgi:hypothetical protein